MFIKDPKDIGGKKSGQGGTIQPGPGGTGVGSQNAEAPSNWVNLQNFITGNQQGGQDIANAFKSDVGTAEQNFNKAGSNLLDTASSAASRGTTAFSDPSKINAGSLSQEDIAVINQKLGGANYSGPTNLADVRYSEPNPLSSKTPYEDYRGSGEALRNKFTNLASNEGLAQESRDIYGKGNANYASGHAMLDALFAGQAAKPSGEKILGGYQDKNLAGSVDRAYENTADKAKDIFNRADIQGGINKENFKTGLQAQYDKTGNYDLEALKNLESLGVKSRDHAAVRAADAAKKKAEEDAKAAAAAAAAEEKRKADEAAAAAKAAEEAKKAEAPGEADVPYGVSNPPEVGDPNNPISQVRDAGSPIITNVPEKLERTAAEAENYLSKRTRLRR